MNAQKKYSWWKRLTGRRSEAETHALALPPGTRGGQRFALVVFFAIGVAATLFMTRDPLGLRGAAAESEPTVVESVTLYQCPMHPEVIEDHPGLCPICQMELQPMQEASGAGGSIRIDPAVVQNTAVVSTPVQLGSISRTLRTVGILDFNADRVFWVNTKFSGWIEKVHVSYVGQKVHNGQPLFDVYSPELVTTQEEYLRAVEYKRSLTDSKRIETQRQADRLLESTRERLLYLGVNLEQIDLMARTHQVQRLITVTAPVHGVVTEIMHESLEGMFVEAGQNLYKIADLSTLWVHADVYQSDLPWVQEGQRAQVGFPSDPGNTREGKVLFLYPELAKETRTLKICVEVSNTDNELRAGMYADVTVHGSPVRNALLIPREAVIRTGTRSVVFVDLGEGRFEPRNVEIGMSSQDGNVQVLSGLSEGERVVTQAQFMLDSESRLQEAIAKFGAGQ